MTVTAVVGAQFGSEGKGTIVNALADEYNVHVRVGAPNAGHSFWHNEPKPWAMQSIPCGWTNPQAHLVIGRGAVVHLGILEREIRAIEAAGYTVRERLLVDSKAFVLEERHHQEEGGIHGEIHRRIGSTGEGVGACRRDRLDRMPGRGMLMEHVGEKWVRELLTDTVEMLHSSWASGANILLEGAQGFGLSLIHGFWPHVTSSDTNAGQLLTDAGLPPRAIDDVILVARTHPIRVAGASGPMNYETNWETMSTKLGRDVCEQTTVTKKTRRIGHWDEDLFLRACMVNGPTQLAVTFTDYLDPKQEGREELTDDTRAFIHYLESITSGVPVKFVGVGGPRWLVVRK